MLRMNWSKGLVLATAGTAVALSVFSSSPAQALTITNNFRVDITEGSLANQSFFGSFRYDDAALTDPSKQIFDPNNGNLLINDSNGLLDLSFNFLGNIYTQASDVSFPDFPQLNFQNGLFQALDFLVFEEPFAPNPVIPGPIIGFITGYDFPGFAPDVPVFLAFAGDPSAAEIVSSGTITYGVQSIPTPALLPGLIGLGIGVFRKRRQQNQNIAPDTAL